jgi:RNA polymerase sigma-70 factor (ECF subfamily)
MTRLADQILVRRALDDDAGSLAELCQRYYPSLVAVARSILLDVHLAEDAAQEALAEACTGLRRLKDPRSFGPWVGSICRNVAKDMLRARKKQCKATEGYAVREPAGSDDRPEELARAVEALPQHLREVLFLRYHSEMTYQQMSSVLGLTPQAINGRLRRAKRRIAALMKSNGFVEE